MPKQLAPSLKTSVGVITSSILIAVKVKRIPARKGKQTSRYRFGTGAKSYRPHRYDFREVACSASQVTSGCAIYLLVTYPKEGLNKPV